VHTLEVCAPSAVPVYYRCAPVERILESVLQCYLRCGTDFKDGLEVRHPRNAATMTKSGQTSFGNVVSAYVATEHASIARAQAVMEHVEREAASVRKPVVNDSQAGKERLKGLGPKRILAADMRVELPRSANGTFSKAFWKSVDAAWSGLSGDAKQAYIARSEESKRAAKIARQKRDASAVPIVAVGSGLASTSSAATTSIVAHPPPQSHMDPTPSALHWNSFAISEARAVAKGPVDVCLATAAACTKDPQTSARILSGNRDEATTSFLPHDGLKAYLQKRSQESIHQEFLASTRRWAPPDSLRVSRRGAV
jgi:hypothetical protein